MESKQEQMKNENNDETGEGQAQMPIMADLVCFQKILSDLQQGLDGVVNQEAKKNQQYYESTLVKLINRLFIEKEGEDDQDDDQDPNPKNQPNNLMTHKNQLLDRVKKELLHRGQYQEVD